MSGLLEEIGLPSKHTVPVVVYWVDGGMLGGKNPSTIGVFWSVYCSTFNEGCPKDGIVVKRQESHNHFTNNDAEWLAVQSALCHASVHHKGQSLIIHSDSELIVNQFMGRYKINKPQLQALAEQAWRIAKGFHSVELQWVSRKVMVKLLGH